MKNPYVENLIEMGYDRADCETVAVAGVDKTFPMNIHGRVYQTQEEYDQLIHFTILSTDCEVCNSVQLCQQSG